MVIAAGVDVVKLSSLGIRGFGIRPVEEEPFNFIGCVQRVAILLKLSGSETLEHSAHVGGVGLSALIDHFAEYHHFARSKNIRGPPVERGPIDTETQIAFPLGRESTNG